MQVLTNSSPTHGATGRATPDELHRLTSRYLREDSIDGTTQRLGWLAGVFSEGENVVSNGTKTAFVHTIIVFN